NLEHAEFTVSVASDGDEPLSAIELEEPDLVVLDWMLPGASGIEICRQVRAKSQSKHLPVIMVTARGAEGDRVRGLETGADDYLVKPFSPAELIARIKALLRRSRPALFADVLEYEDITVDLIEHKVARGQGRIKLSPTEYRLLITLMERPGRVFSRDYLLDHVWGRDIYVEGRSVDVAIRRLRKALNANGSKNLIRTIRGSGYSLDVEAGL
ncbi:MAG: winged helix-turn-helix domain-containing protein, partial [Rhodospirillaceae bacterium]